VTSASTSAAAIVPSRSSVGLNRDIEADDAAVSHDHAPKSGQLVEAQAVGQPVIDGRHDRVVEDAGGAASLARTRARERTGTRPPSR
jgi:hypothetical protein